MKKPIISVHLWTERFLGSPEMASSFLSLLKRLDGGKWTPDRWSQFEPIRERFTAEAEERIMPLWCEERGGRVSNVMLFKKARPSMLLVVTSWRGRVPDLNDIWFDLDAKEFSGPDGVSRLKSIIAEFVRWSGAAYAAAWRSGQEHCRSAPGNPRQRLDQLNWLAFFGAPYLALIGEDRIKACSFHTCDPIADGLMVTAAETPDMSDSSNVLLDLERCLGVDIFATDAYPDIPCRVPTFDLSQTVNRPRLN